MDPRPAPPASLKPLRVGLTGGIASGKTTVSLLFGALGVPVIDADQVARDVVAPGTRLLAQVFESFGAQLRRPDGSLDRTALRRLVFADAGKRRAARSSAASGDPASHRAAGRASRRPIPDSCDSAAGRDPCRIAIRPRAAGGLSGESAGGATAGARRLRSGTGSRHAGVPGEPRDAPRRRRRRHPQ